ncbi:MAG: zinc dependent phospholipase C family protein [Acidobacteriia bacterium]|nr:zinc dependent phospholipase C family protein [Terriglobia bacterium]
MIPQVAAAFWTLAVLLITPQVSLGYATFTHEELIDLAWNDSIRPLLLERFPGTTDAELEAAYAFAYGGCLIQDLGYYPFGKKEFSDLAHYVRSGDFVQALLRNARSVNELAFAVGALSHYVGDWVGHSEAINPSTAITFPDLEKKYGALVTYEDSPTAHVRTEFGFDVAQIAWRRYAPGAYRRHIGFRVSRQLLQRAYFETYGLTVHSILGPPRSALTSYRSAVRWIVPLFARATIVNMRRHLPPDPPNAPLNQLLSTISQTNYAKYWSQYHRDPSVQAYLLGFLIRFIPKVGILRILAIKAPSMETENLFVESLNDAVARFGGLLTKLAKEPSGDLALNNLDLDTGAPVRPGAYKLTDQTYAQLLHQVTQQPNISISPGLRENILSYYADPAAAISTRKNPKAWKQVLSELAILKGEQNNGSSIP